MSIISKFMPRETFSMKVSDLEGSQLDYWVAKADGGPHFDGPWNSSTDWDEAGPIIEREHICIGFDEDEWWACTGISLDDPPEDGASIFYDGRQEGSTPLIAAMRCFVASKFGDEVPKDDLSWPDPFRSASNLNS